jgi:hypothetical protein
VANPNQSEKSNALDREENITRGNLSAKRVVNYAYDSSTDTLQPAAPNLTPGTDYDYIDVQQTDTDTETYVYKLGGSGGTTVRTVVVNYTDATKANIDNVAWS